MPKTPEAISTLTLAPCHLFQAESVKNKTALFLITDSYEKFWMKQVPTDWEEVNVDKYEIYRDGGTRVYSFSGKEYDKLYIPSSFTKNKPYISGYAKSVVLTELMLSKEKLKEIGIKNQIKLNLKDIPDTIADAEKVQDAENARKPKERFDFFNDDILDFLCNKNLIKQKETESATKKLFRFSSSDLFDGASFDNSEPGTSSASETLISEVKKLKI